MFPWVTFIHCSTARHVLQDAPVGIVVLDILMSITSCIRKKLLILCTLSLAGS